ncbi:hypothetical protein G7Y89_g253 [Cudoniella acicularis]|uniref:Uncharacterized protein n=1 Tax=Cudoniella acicularis TaxID=354080 RepID=A0A8H4W8H5_9HELO|nr:hypothetical protein G7Y89_g253 [Cudoniella acicularis]
MNADAEDAPPPPYTPTDIFSNAGTTSNFHLSPAASRADDASVAATSSAAGSVIYTPLPSPPGSVNHDLDHGLEDGLSHQSSSSAAAYFDSRPVPAGYAASSQLVYHDVIVTSNTRPYDIPYPNEWASKDVSQQDWATFLNYLLPDHYASVNEDVADRKLRAELLDEQMSRLDLKQEDKSRSDQVSAQLEPLRQPPSPRIHTAASTVAEWNENFFHPRGIRITISDPQPEINPDGRLGIPGEWIPYDHEILTESVRTNEGGPNTGPSRKGMFGGFKNSFPGVEASSRGFKLGPIVADNTGFRIGKNGLVADNNGFRMGRNGLVADNNGFRMGNMLVADHKGFRLGGSRGFIADSRGVSMGGRTFGRKEGQDHTHRGRGRGHGFPGHQHAGPAPRRRSASVSSSSSSSSSSSESSLGSLPDYDDLKEQQLPTAKQSLMEWLNHPEHPITKSSVRDLKHQIKDAKKNSPQRHDQDMKELRQEVKNLLKMFKESKKAQKKERKQAKRERRTARRELKKEHRGARKEERRSRREGKKCARAERRNHPPWGASSSSLPVPGNTGHFPMQPPTMDMPSSSRGFPFGRAGSAPVVNKPQDLMTPPMPLGPPGIAAMHGGWPFTQGLPYAPGRISAPRGEGPSPVSRGSEQIHAQAHEMAMMADSKEAEAVKVHIAMTSPDVGEKDRLKMMDQATALEEEAGNYRREADRLTAEAMHLDSELARELEEEIGMEEQQSGVIHD